MTLTGFYVRLADRMDLSANARLLALARGLLSDPPPGVTDLVPSYVSLYVEFDAQRVSDARVRRWVAGHTEGGLEPPPGRHVEIPVRYDGPDLPWVAEQTGLSLSEVVRLHSEPAYRVFATGFTPGFPFLGPLDERLKLPRRGTPRTQVPAHSVAIAGTQTGVYPLPSPGGWHLIGSALRALYDPHRAPAFLLEAGDTVRFVPSEGETPGLPGVLELLPQEPRRPVLRVEQPGLLDLVTGGGRWMGGRFGLAASGAVDPWAASLANRLVGNPPDLPLLELTLTGPTLTLLAPAVAAFAGGGLRPVLNGEPLAPAASFGLKRGDVLSFRPEAWGVRGYLAVAGGVESRTFFGSASPDLKGRIGRPLRAGDVLGVAEPRAARAGLSFAQARRPESPARVRLLPGPQRSAEALAALTSGLFTLASGDRMGLRLSGPQVPGGELLSEATPLGAVQITPQGQPIVLLNDRGRIGGYAKPAVVHPADLPKLAQLRPGERVRFVGAEG